MSAFPISHPSIHPSIITPVSPNQKIVFRDNPQRSSGAKPPNSWAFQPQTESPIRHGRTLGMHHLFVHSFIHPSIHWFSTKTFHPERKNSKFCPLSPTDTWDFRPMRVIWWDVGFYLFYFCIYFIYILLATEASGESTSVVAEKESDTEIERATRVMKAIAKVVFYEQGFSSTISRQSLKYHKR